MRDFLNEEVSPYLLDPKFRHRYEQYFLQAFLAFVAMAIILLFVESLSSAAIAAGLGSSVVGIFINPNGATARLRAMVGGHTMALLSGSAFSLHPVRRVHGDLHRRPQLIPHSDYGPLSGTSVPGDGHYGHRPSARRQYHHRHGQQRIDAGSVRGHPWRTRFAYGRQVGRPKASRRPAIDLICSPRALETRLFLAFISPIQYPVLGIKKREPSQTDDPGAAPHRHPHLNHKDFPDA